MSDKNCPLLPSIVVVQDENHNPLSQIVKCIEENCAWWIEDKQRCAITELAIKAGAKR